MQLLPPRLMEIRLFRLPLCAVGNVREIANATLFFASDESSYCTGTHLMVDGGQTPCTIMDW